MANVPDPVLAGVVARPSRRSLGLVLPPAVVCTPLWVVAASQELMATSVLGSAPLFLLWRHVAYVLLARTTAGPDGIRNRTIRTTEHLTWDDVESFEVGTNGFGRMLSVRRRGGGSVDLAAPREGLVALGPEFEETTAALLRTAPADLPVNTSAGAAPSRRERLRLGWTLIGVFLVAFAGLSAAFDRPWNSPLWPGRHEASSVPSACEVLGLAPASALVPSGPPTSQSSTTSTRSDCATEGSAQTATRLRLRYDRYDREIGWGGSGSHLAHVAFAKPNPFLRAAWAPVTGLGDEARSAVPRSGGGHNWVEVVARRANVVVTVDYMAPGATGQATAGATRTAAAAISQIRLR